MHETSDFKKRLKILIDNVPVEIVDFQHVKPGKGNQFTRT
ncbi:MAG: elongation factor P, partial [Pseudobdellovibrionaceae bacterium]